MLICRSSLCAVNIYFVLLYCCIMSYYVSNNHKILVAYTKQVDCAISMSRCQSVSQLGQVCSCVFIWGPTWGDRSCSGEADLMAVAWGLFSLTSSPKCQYRYILSALFEPYTHKYLLIYQRISFVYEFPSWASYEFLLYKPFIRYCLPKHSAQFLWGKKSFCHLVYVICRSVT